MNEKAQPNDEAVPARRAGIRLERRQVLHHEAGAALLSLRHGCSGRQDDDRGLP
jgi:hypothetical protein